MEVFNIYLAGGMSGLTQEEMSSWRFRIREAILFEKQYTRFTPEFFDPTQYYSIFSHEHKTEKEVMNFDLYNLRRSNLVIVNLNSKKSIGTAMELAIARELRIPVIALDKDGGENHPWVVECIDRLFDNMRELVDYVVNYYLK